MTSSEPPEPTGSEGTHLSTDTEASSKPNGLDRGENPPGAIFDGVGPFLPGGDLDDPAEGVVLDSSERAVRQLSVEQARGLVEALEGSFSIRSLPLTIIAVVSGVFFLRFAQTLIAPIVVAAILHFLLAPVVRKAEKIGISTGFAAAMILLALFGITSGGVAYLSEPAMAWLEEIPAALRDADERLLKIKKPVEAIASVADQVESITDLDNGAVIVPVESSEGGSERMTQVGSTVASGFASMFLLFFLLLGTDDFLRSLTRILPRLREKKMVVSIARSVEKEISRYLVTVTMINAGLGLGVGILCWLLGVPSPVLWGVLAACFNFVPYAGTLVGSMILGVVSLLTFDEIWRVFAAPGGYIGLSAIEGMLVTPAVLGSRLRLRPVVLFAWLLAWSWLWGIVGALLAVPLLVITKIVCDHVPKLFPIGEFLSDSTAEESTARPG